MHGALICVFSCLRFDRKRLKLWGAARFVSGANSLDNVAKTFLGLHARLTAQNQAQNKNHDRPRLKSSNLIGSNGRATQNQPIRLLDFKCGRTE